MNVMLGERKELKARRIKQLTVGLLILFVAGGSLGYFLRIDPEDSTHPLDIVQGTGTNVEGLQLVFVGPDELEVKWEETMGHALSCTQISGWIRNNSGQHTVRFKSIAGRIKNAAGDVIWEEKDLEFMERFGPGHNERYALGPNEYIDFMVFPLCTTEARKFELAVVEDEVIGS